MAQAEKRQGGRVATPKVEVAFDSDVAVDAAVARRRSDFAAVERQRRFVAVGFSAQMEA